MALKLWRWGHKSGDPW